MREGSGGRGDGAGAGSGSGENDYELYQELLIRYGPMAGSALVGTRAEDSDVLPGARPDSYRPTPRPSRVDLRGHCLSVTAPLVVRCPPRSPYGPHCALIPSLAKHAACRTVLRTAYCVLRTAFCVFVVGGVASQ